MTIETNVGNFGSFKDLGAFMTDKKLGSVDLLKADLWGTNIKLFNAMRLSFPDVLTLADASAQ